MEFKKGYYYFTKTISNDEYEELLWKSESFDRYERDFGTMTR